MPEVDKKYKCHHCTIVIPEGALVNGNCPQCNAASNLTVMCPNDTIACDHTVTEGVAYCPECQEAMCPICGCHNVEIISRITGYMSALEGWNSAKKQEFVDRTRVMNKELGDMSK